MHISFESIKNWQRCQFLKIFVIPGGNTPPTKSSWVDTSATLPNRNGRYQGTTCTSWLNFYTPCKSQPISLPYYIAHDFAMATAKCEMHVLSLFGKLFTGPWMTKFYTFAASTTSHMDDQSSHFCPQIRRGRSVWAADMFFRLSW